MSIISSIAIFSNRPKYKNRYQENSEGHYTVSHSHHGKLPK